ncbi:MULTISPECIES: GGDEF domain-containing protein [unclassified Shewanella]|uniref:GGDEF domain-containing protein n=1 Tax=unclassified Shewanella TaxID=196818 RepID=UPI001BB88479|nr:MULTISPECIES: GGDEF domain-containing protein [unclassified Shewanella]GIU05126.1 GGDEF domain-containing protein [Shewanella sp. MBTL60-112-B1]GIU24371.1 GGDEF domain-containing protein [Shewanella sp. MBTL60-112-B2]
MSAFYHSCRYFFIPIILTGFVLTLFQLNQAHLLVWQGIIEQLPFWLLPAAIAISLQFNRSRLAYLAALMLAYFVATTTHLLGTIDQAYSNQILLGGAFTMAWFAFIKDRGLISPHSLVRLAGVILSFMAAFGWLWANNEFKLQLDGYLAAMFSIDVRTLSPLYLCIFIVAIRGVWQANLVNTSIFITLVLWAVHFITPAALPLPISMTLLASIYILTVLTDSYFLAYRDELTGLASRRALFNLVLSLGRKYSVAMLDIDHFKKFNDTYGHDVGDQVLKLVASKIGGVRGGGKAFRYGGEEFTIIFPRKDSSATLDYLEEVRESIEEYDIVLRDDKRKSQSKATRGKTQHKAKTVSVTISIGVAEHHSSETFEQTMKRSDQALYKAKKKGRNQICA